MKYMLGKHDAWCGAMVWPHRALVKMLSCATFIKRTIIEVTWFRGTWHGQRGQGTISIGGVLYMEGRKEVPPYYAQNNHSSTWQQGPTGRATVFHEKTFPPWLLRPTSYIFASKEVPPYYAQKNEYSPCQLGPSIVGGWLVGLLSWRGWRALSA